MRGKMNTFFVSRPPKKFQTHKCCSTSGVSWMIYIDVNFYTLTFEEGISQKRPLV